MYILVSTQGFIAAALIVIQRAGGTIIRHSVVGEFEAGSFLVIHDTTEFRFGGAIGVVDSAACL